MIYTVTFNPAIDYVLHLTAPLAVGEINRTSDEACQFGGKGINVSGVLRELGCEHYSRSHAGPVGQSGRTGRG